MPSNSSDTEQERALLTIKDMARTLDLLIEWNKNVTSSEAYYSTPGGMQLLAANCTLITAIGEGVNRCNRLLPGFLSEKFPEIPWRAIIGMRNHITHGYFELDADMVFEAVSNDLLPLQTALRSAVAMLSSQAIS